MTNFDLLNTPSDRPRTPARYFWTETAIAVVAAVVVLIAGARLVTVPRVVYRAPIHVTDGLTQGLTTDDGRSKK